jgi:hypothetical protein
MLSVVEERCERRLKFEVVRGAEDPVLRVNPAYTSWMPRPKLRKLALTGTYEHFQFPVQSLGEMLSVVEERCERRLKFEVVRGAEEV